MSVEIKLYASECGRNLRYFQRIQEAAGKLALDYFAEQITEEDDLEAKGIVMPCMFLYCLGCEEATKNVKDSEPDAVCAPGLEVNGKLIFWDRQATDEELLELLKPYRSVKS